MFNELITRISRALKQNNLPYLITGKPRDLEDVHSIIVKNPDFDRVYTRKWLREFDRSMELGWFIRVFEDILKAAG